MRAARALARAFLTEHPAEAASVLEVLPPDEIARLLQIHPRTRAAGVFVRLTPQQAADTLRELDEVRAGELLSDVDPRRAAALLGTLDPAVRDKLLGLLAPHLASELRELMTYPADSAGALMDVRVPMAFRHDRTVRDVIARLRTLRRRRVFSVFVLDHDDRLLGVLPLQDVVLATPSDRLGDLLRFAPITVPVTASREEVIDTITKHNIPTLPVLDYDERLVGVIRHDALVAAAAEEATADIQTMVGVSKDERALSSPAFSIRKRLPWLQINLLTAFAAASVVGVFEDTIARFTALAVLLPVVAGQSGNTGAQALAVTLRGLALREIRAKQWLRVTTKETVVGAINGLAVAATTCLGVYVWSRSPGLCLVIGVAMVLSMLIAGMAGAAIPLLLTAVRQDPAQSSSIILTTVTDITGFFSFLGLATLFSRLL